MLSRFTFNTLEVEVSNKNAAQDALMRKLFDLLVAEFGMIEVHLNLKSPIPIAEVIFLDFEDWRKNDHNRNV